MILVVGKSHRKSTINPFYILGPISLVLLLAAAVWAGSNAMFIKKAVPVTGTVIDLVEQGRGVTPLIRFDNTTGEQFRFKPHSSQSPSPYVIGDQVNVYYDPVNPAHSKLDSFVGLWFGPLMLGIAGLVNLILGIILGRIFKHRHSLIQKSS